MSTSSQTPVENLQIFPPKSFPDLASLLLLRAYIVIYWDHAAVHGSVLLQVVSSCAGGKAAAVLRQLVGLTAQEVKDGNGRGAASLELKAATAAAARKKPQMKAVLRRPLRRSTQATPGEGAYFQRRC